MNQGTDMGIRNGADVLLRTLAATVLGDRGPLLFGGLVALVLLFLAVRDGRRAAGPSAAPALRADADRVGRALAVFGFGGIITAQLVNALPQLAIGQKTDMPWPVVFMVSLGAGVYEELVFRVLRVGPDAGGPNAVRHGKRRRHGVCGRPRRVDLLGLPLHGPYGDPPNCHRSSSRPWPASRSADCM